MLVWAVRACVRAVFAGRCDGGGGKKKKREATGKKGSGWVVWLLGGLNEAGTHPVKVVFWSNSVEKVDCESAMFLLDPAVDSTITKTLQILSVGSTNGQKAEKEKPRRRCRHPTGCHLRAQRHPPPLLCIVAAHVKDSLKMSFYSRVQILV